MERITIVGREIIRTFPVRKKFDDIYICDSDDHLIWAKHEDMEGYIIFQDADSPLGINEAMTPAQFEKYRNLERNDKNGL